MLAVCCDRKKQTRRKFPYANIKQIVIYSSVRLGRWFSEFRKKDLLPELCPFSCPGEGNTNARRKSGNNQRIVQGVASQKAVSLTVSILVNGTEQGVVGGGDGGDDVEYTELERTYTV